MKEYPLEGRILSLLNTEGESTIVGITNRLFPDVKNRFMVDHMVITAVMGLVIEGRVKHALS